MKPGRPRKYDRDTAESVVAGFALLQHVNVRNQLVRNLARRRRAAREFQEAREELVSILRGGRTLSDPLDVVNMARSAEIRREVAHRFIREGSKPLFLETEYEEAPDELD